MSVMFVLNDFSHSAFFEVDIHNERLVPRLVSDGHDACVNHERIFARANNQLRALCRVYVSGFVHTSHFLVYVNFGRLLDIRLLDMGLRPDVQLIAFFPLHELCTPPFVDMAKAVQLRLAALHGPKEMLTANMIPCPHSVQDSQRWAMGHHHINAREIRNWPFSNRHGTWRALITWIVPVLVPVIREGKIAELGLIGRCVDLQRAISTVCSSEPVETRTRSRAPFAKVKMCVPSSRYVTPARRARSPSHISRAFRGRSGS